MKYQSVFTYSTIDIFDEWSPKALFSIALREMAGCEAAQKLKVLSQYKYLVIVQKGFN